MTAAADRHLLFGLLALQNGLIDQGQLLSPPSRPGPATSPGAWPTTLKPAATSTADKRAAGRLWRGPPGSAWRRCREEPGRRPGQPLHLRQSGGAGRARDRGYARPGRMRGRDGNATEADDDDDPDRTAGLSAGAATSDGQRFRMLRPHARGGLGEVFVALDAELHREVALKQILEKHADDPVSRQRFVAEAEITGGLEHPGIVPVYGVGTAAGGRPYYAMRFIKGDSLKEAIEHFHGDDALKAQPRSPILGAAQARCAGSLDVCNADRLRPFSRRDPSRPEAGQHHPGQARRDAGGGLGTGQGHRPGRPVGRRADDRAVVERTIGNAARQRAWARRPT